MEIEKFIESFASQFEVTDPNVFAANTAFKDLDEWSSFMALSIIAMVDEEYNVKLKGEDIRNSQTMEDLFNVVKQKI